MKKIIYFMAVIFFPVSVFSQVSQQWSADYQNLPLAGNYGMSVTSDNSGNVYVAVQSDSIPTSADFTTIKYNSAGARQWVRRYDGPISSVDYPKSIKTDASGNVYVAGTSQGADTTDDFAVVKYNSSGVQQWVARYSAPGEIDELNSMVLDNSGNIYVAGRSYSNVTQNDIVIVKYNSGGVQQWLARYTDSEDSYTPFIKINNSNGNVYVAAITNMPASGEDYMLLKYNSSGTQQWVRTYNSDSTKSDVPANLAIDASENIIVGGTTNYNSLKPDITILKYNSAGTLQWSKVHNDSADYARDIAIDASGNIYVTGMIYHISLFYNFTKTIKYNSSGTKLWEATYTHQGSDDPITMLLDTLGNVYIGGNSFDNTSSNDFAVVKYNTSGVQQWVTRYNFAGNSADYLTSMALDNSGNIVATGQTYQPSTSYNYATTVKFTQNSGALILGFTGYIEGFYNPSTNLMTGDTCRITLRNTNSPYNKVDSGKAKLSNAGAANFSFSSAVNGVSYYIVMQHRNSIETWSSTGNAFVSGILNYNFSTAANKAYGNNQKQVDSNPLRFAVYGGDINQDGTVDATDLSLIDNAAFNFLAGYVVTDVTGDEVVDASDAAIADNNAANFVSKVTP